jgi:hypothetical protein
MELIWRAAFAVYWFDFLCIFSLEQFLHSNAFFTRMLFSILITTLFLGRRD